MSVLAAQEIEELVATLGLIQDFDKTALQGASYDMRMGAQCVIRGQITTLTPERSSHPLEPGDFMLLSSFETLQMPLDMVGHNGIMSPWAKRGLVSLFSPQIDPGFRGRLLVPVFNAGDATIILAFETRIFTIEFVRTSRPAPYGWSERHGDQRTFSSDQVFVASRPNLADLTTIETRLSDLEGLVTASTNVLHNELTSLSTGPLKDVEHRVDVAEKSIPAAISAFSTQLTSVSSTMEAKLDGQIGTIRAELAGLSNLVNTNMNTKQLKLSRQQVIVGMVAILAAVLIAAWVGRASAPAPPAPTTPTTLAAPPPSSTTLTSTPRP